MFKFSKSFKGLLIAMGIFLPIALFGFVSVQPLFDEFGRLALSGKQLGVFVFACILLAYCAGVILVYVASKNTTPFHMVDRNVYFFDRIIEVSKIRNVWLESSRLIRNEINVQITLTNGEKLKGKPFYVIKTELKEVESWLEAKKIPFTSTIAGVGK